MESIPLSGFKLVNGDRILIEKRAFAYALPVFHEKKSEKVCGCQKHFYLCTPK
jgi:hypothetical protein